MDNMYGLLITLFTGGFILIGSLITFLTKNNNRFVHFSISTAFGVMISLVALELIPEILNIFGEHYDTLTSILVLLLFSVFGILVVKGFDLFIPEHAQECCNEHDHNENFYHIGIVSIVALFIHQFIEGMAVYGTAVSSLQTGFVLSLGIGLHSIPLGMIITSTLYKATNNIKKTLGMILSLVMAPFLGGLLMVLNENLFSSEFILGILLSLTVGMIFYITAFELFPHLRDYKNRRTSILGILIGVLIMLFSMQI